MKTIFFVTVLFFACLSTVVAKSQDFDPDKSLHLVNAGAVLIDVRTAKEYQQSHIKGAIHIPYDQIKDHLERLEQLTKKDKDKAIVLYCQSGRRSGIAKQTLLTLNYTNITNHGGIGSWKQATSIVTPTIWSPKEGAALIGTKAPSLKGLQWVQGEPLDLSAFSGEAVLLRFWTSQCPLCTQTAPALNALWQRYKDKGLIVVGIHHPKSPLSQQVDTVKRSIKSLKFEFPIAIDQDWSVIERYGVGTVFKQFTSISVLIDQTGVIRFVHDGGEFHEGGGQEHQQCQHAYIEMDRQIQALLGDAL